MESEPLTVDVGGDLRRAWADPALVGEVLPGDEVIVNTEAADLGLGSGGFDIVCANLTRGLEGAGAADGHVMKLNYSPIQHPVRPVEPELDGEGAVDADVGSGAAGAGEAGRDPLPGREPSRRHPMPVLVIPLHGHLAPAAFAAAAGAEGLRIGYVQTAGGALPGGLSRDVADLRGRGLICGHVTAAPCYGGEYEAISVAGALDAAAGELGWDAAIAGPGPGILGSASRLGHGGMAALDTAHAALSLGLPALLSPRLSEADPRPRHRGLSHHTATVLELLLGAVEVAVPEGADDVAAAVAGLGAGPSHRVREGNADLDAYARSGLSRRTMGRDIEEDRLFFAAPLAAGSLLAAALTRS